VALNPVADFQPTWYKQASFGLFPFLGMIAGQERQRIGYLPLHWGPGRRQQ